MKSINEPAQCQDQQLKIRKLLQAFQKPEIIQEFTIPLPYQLRGGYFDDNNVLRGPVLDATTLPLQRNNAEFEVGNC